MISFICDRYILSLIIVIIIIIENEQGLRIDNNTLIPIKTYEQTNKLLFIIQMETLDIY